VAIVEGPNNRDLSNRFIEEVINGRKLSLIDETVAEDFVYIDSTIGTVKGRDSLKEPQREAHPNVLLLPRPSLDCRAVPF